MIKMIETAASLALEMYKAVKPIVKAILTNGKRTTRSKWYSPQLSREIVSRLYYKAKTEGVPMTRLASRLIKEALDSTESLHMPIPNENNAWHDSK